MLEQQQIKEARERRQKARQEANVREQQDAEKPAQDLLTLEPLDSDAGGRTENDLV